MEQASKFLHLSIKNDEDKPYLMFYFNLLLHYLDINDI